MRFAATVLVLVLAARPALAHGASRGLHLHVTPDTASPGGTVAVAADAALPIARLRAAFVGADPSEVRPRRPRRRVVVTLTLPKTVAGATASVHAEVETASGKTLRAAALVKVLRRE